MKKLGIITYHYPHLKTEQVLTTLIDLKNFDLHIYALPFTKRPERQTLISHRPDQANAVCCLEIAQRFSLSYTICLSDLDIPNDCDLYLACGCGILSKDCVENKKIINVHPGVIPLARGLDSFKWSILNDIPVGNSLHYITEDIDAGEIIAIKETPVYKSDSIETLARRHYELEILLMSNFQHFIDLEEVFLTKFIGNYLKENKENNAPTKRMPLNMEHEMYLNFNKYKKKFALDEK